MDEIEARHILRSLRRELADAEATVAAAQHRVGALQKLVSGYVELFPALAAPDATAPPDEVTKPRGQEAVLKVMESPEFRGRYWTVTAMTDALSERAWLPESNTPGNAVRTALDRLAEKEPRVHKGPGSHGVVWYWQGDGMQPPRFAGERTDSERTDSTTGGLLLPQGAPDGG
ncbi:MAG TPA: hypothetical protein VFZ79_04825 [Acidimicrobiales bacterium]